MNDIFFLLEILGPALHLRRQVAIFLGVHGGSSPSFLANDKLGAKGRCSVLPVANWIGVFGITYTTTKP